VGGGRGGVGEAASVLLVRVQTCNVQEPPLVKARVAVMPLQ
jgi:hypothetical protein